MPRGSDQGGFTFIEVLAVVLLLGVLALVALPNYFGAQADARTAIRVSNVASVNAGVALYQYRNGACPGTAGMETFPAFLADAVYFPDGSPVDPFTQTNASFITNYSTITCRTN